jgi:uncharacterized coiled-coil protein SlyX
VNRTPLRHRIEELASLATVQSEEIAELRAQLAERQSAFMSERDVARELRKRRSMIRDWKKSGKLRPVDVGGRHPKFLRADIERIKAEGVTVLTRAARKSRAPRAPTLPVEVEPLEMLARAHQLAKAARDRDKRERAGSEYQSRSKPTV